MKIREVVAQLLYEDPAGFVVICFVIFAVVMGTITVFYAMHLDHSQKEFLQTCIEHNNTPKDCKELYLR